MTKVVKRDEPKGKMYGRKSVCRALMLAKKTDKTGEEKRDDYCCLFRPVHLHVISQKGEKVYGRKSICGVTMFAKK